jgi:hypothetical protein
MIYRLFSAVAILLAASSCPVLWAANDGDEPLKDWPMKDDRSEELEKIRHIAVSANPEQLQKLVVDSNDGIAVRAAWERVRRQLAEDIATDGQKNPDGALLKGASQFVSFLEGRLRVPVPHWWASELGLARARELERPSFFCSVDTMGDIWSQIDRMGRGVSSAFGFVPAIERSKSGEVKAAWNNHKLQLSSKQISNDPAPGDDLAGLVYRGRCLIVRYDRNEFWWLNLEIYCADPSSSKIVWSTRRTFGDRRAAGGRSGSSIHHIALLCRDDVVFVFGMEFSMIYIEAFRLSDGRPLMRFNSTY